ncbi:MAG: DUF4838 domain-containing protein, partial [Victivallales bacterium]|nr:DUF4838 domain-containing protein [Victivallales bacterium]
MRRTLLALLVGIMFPMPMFTAVFAGELVLVENGKSDYVIAVPQEDENRRVGRAAEALQKYLKEATGAELPIVTEDKVEGRAFYLGKTVKGEQAGVPYADLQDYTHCEMVSPNGNVFLAGLDDSCHVDGDLTDPDVQFHHDRAYLMQPKGFNLDIKDRSYREWRGTHKAVLSFLEDWCGIRFLLPGENGRFIPKVERLVVPDDLRKVTHLDFPYCYGRCYGDWDTTIALNHNEMPFYKNYGGHSFPVAVPKKIYGETHPEYYILKDGKRQPYFGPGGANHLCTSNPDVQELMLKEFGNQYDKGFRWIQIAPTDGQVECECEECKKMHPDKTERQWLLFRKLAEEIAVRWPDAHPVFLAYGYTRNPPKTFKTFPANTLIELCPWKHLDDEMKKWEEFQDLPKLVYIYFFGAYHSTIFSPVRTPRYIAEGLRTFKKHNIKGIFKCGWAVCLGLEGPECYVFSKLLEDTTRDENELLKEFCKCAYGKAAPQMEKFFTMLYSHLDTPDGQSIIDALETVPRNAALINKYAYRPYELKQMRNLLNSSIATAKDEDARVQARLKLVKREFDYLYNRCQFYRLDDAFSNFPCADLIKYIEDALKERDKILGTWFDDKGNMLHEPGFDWPFLEDTPKDIIYYGGREIIGPYPATFRKGVGPLKQSLKMATNPEDNQFLIQAINRKTPQEWAKGQNIHSMLSFGDANYPVMVAVAKHDDKLAVFAKCFFGKAKKPASMADWQKTALPLEEERFEFWVDDQGEGKRFCHF